MSSATATRPRRAKKAVGKASKRKKSTPVQPSATAIAVTKPAAKKGKAPPSHQPDITRPKPKMRSSPPPVDLEIDPDVLQFIKAIDDYRATHDRPFPSWSEVLYVLKRLGYRKS